MLGGCGFNDVATLDCVFPLIGTLIYWLLVFAGTVALVIIIISGLRFITSGGDAKSVETAKKSMTFALLGLLLVFLAFLILNTIAYVTGVACLGDILKGNFGFTTCQTTITTTPTIINCARGTCEVNYTACPTNWTPTGATCTDSTGSATGVCCSPNTTGSGCPTGVTCESASACASSFGAIGAPCTGGFCCNF